MECDIWSYPIFVIDGFHLVQSQRHVQLQTSMKNKKGKEPVRQSVIKLRVDCDHT